MQKKIPSEATKSISSFSLLETIFAFFSTHDFSETKMQKLIFFTLWAQLCSWDCDDVSIERTIQRLRVFQKFEAFIFVILSKAALVDNDGYWSIDCQSKWFEADVKEEVCGRVNNLRRWNLSSIFKIYSLFIGDMKKRLQLG